MPKRRTGLVSVLGRLVAVSFMGRKHHNAVWLFRCDCGPEHGASISNVARQDSALALPRAWSRRWWRSATSRSTVLEGNVMAEVDGKEATMIAAGGVALIPAGAAFGVE